MQALKILPSLELKLFFYHKIAFACEKHNTHVSTLLGTYSIKTAAKWLFFSVQLSKSKQKSASSQTNHASSMLCGCASNHYIAIIRFKHKVRKLTAHASTHRQTHVSRMSTLYQSLISLSYPCSGQANHTSFNPQSYVEVLTCEKGLKAK